MEEADPLLLEVRGLVGQLTEIPLKLDPATHTRVPLCPHPSCIAFGACQHRLTAMLGSLSLGASSAASPSGHFKTITHPDSRGPLKRDRLRETAQVGMSHTEPPFLPGFLVVL